jgi:uncharacterized protein YjbJ (UPF0337 family)
MPGEGDGGQRMWRGSSGLPGSFMAATETVRVASAVVQLVDEPSMDYKTETPMNKQTLEGNWQQLKGKAIQRWGQLTNDDLDVVRGKREEIEGKLRERYGWAQERVKREVDDFEREHLR